MLGCPSFSVCGRLTLLLDMAPARSRTVKDVIARLDGSRGFQLLPRVTGRERHTALREDPHEPPDTDVIVLEQEDSVWLLVSPRPCCDMLLSKKT